MIFVHLHRWCSLGPSLQNFSALTGLCAPGSGTLCQFCSSCCWVSYPSQVCREYKCASRHLLCIHLVSWSAIKWTVCYNQYLKHEYFAPFHISINAVHGHEEDMLLIGYGNSEVCCQNSEMAPCCTSGALFFLALQWWKPYESTLVLWHRDLCWQCHTCMSHSATGVWLYTLFQHSLADCLADRECTWRTCLSKIGKWSFQFPTWVL